MRSHSLSMVVAGAALVALLAGCTARNTFPTVQDVKDFAKEEREALNAHDTNMTKQHIAQHPDASGAIIASATTFRAEMGEIAKRVDAMEGSLKPFLERGLSGVLAMIRKLTGINLPLVDLFDKQDAKADVNEKQGGANAVAIDDLEKWAEDMKAAAAKRSAQEREMQALLAALDGVCPLCRGTGNLTPNQKRHWNAFTVNHDVAKCGECDETHLTCSESRSKKVHG